MALFGRLVRRSTSLVSSTWKSSPLLGNTVHQTQKACFCESNESDESKELPIDSSKVEIHFTKSPKPKTADIDPEKIKFGKEFSDHMLEIDWHKGQGWSAPVIRPYGPLTLDPACSVFHYALEGFEGLKAYLDKQKNIRLFRPDQNVKRLLRTCEALSFPQFNGEEYQKCLDILLNVDKDWIPDVGKDGYSLYIRPTVISTHPFIGVAEPESIKLYVILSPAGPYYGKDFKAISLLADDRFVRAWPKGTGHYKIGGNYGPTIRASKEALAKDYDQILWLFGDEHYVTEVGTSNQFFFWENEMGERELITAPLDGTILPGVTRDSILAITREWDRFKVRERPYTMAEVVKAVKDGRMIEAFGAGTAAVVSPVRMIGYLEEEIIIPLDPNDKDAKFGPLAKELFSTLMDIQYGKVEHPYSVVVPEYNVDLLKQ